MTIADKIANLQNLSTAELAAEFERLHGKPPRYRSVPWMRKRVAYAMQVAAYGGLCGPARAELDRLAAEVRLPAAAPGGGTSAATDPGANQPRPGTVLQRQWRDRLIRVRVEAEGFTYEGEHFGSLSAVAKRVTGQHWSGPRFFNLVTRKEP